MSEESNAESKPAPRRRARRTSTGTSTRSTTTRRRRVQGAELVDNLNAMVNELIKENRKLRRQVERLTSKGAAAASGTVERGLRTIQRRVQRAIGGASATTRRRRTTSARTTTRRRTTTTRRPRRASGGSSSSS